MENVQLAIPQDGIFVDLISRVSEISGATMANANFPLQYESLDIGALVTSRCHELGFSRAELVQRAGYKNVAKGMRRLDSLLSGDFETSKSLIEGLPSALILPADAINCAVEETRRQVQKTKRHAAEQAEAVNRDSGVLRIPVSL